MIRLRTRVAALALAPVMALPLLPAAAEAPTSGSSGIGDSYWPLDGNGGIDVHAYRIKQRYDLARKQLRGTTRITLDATADLASFNLDFLLPVSKVSVDGKKAKVKQRFHEVTITPRTPLASGSRYRVKVTYAGNPARKKYAGERNWLADTGEVVSMNEPHMAPWWFPSNDHPSDKAKFDVSTTVKRGTKVIGNGHLVSRKKTRRSVTWRWRAKEPMATYLAFFAAGDFALVKGKAHGLEYVNAVSRRLSPHQQRMAKAFLKPTAEVAKVLSADLGPYPFSTTGGVVTSLPVMFALENQTRPTYPFVGGRARSLLVHEIAHQWFGNHVAVAQWRDIWLNEGFASFMEWRYAESTGGTAAADTLQHAYNGRAAGDPFWRLTIGDPGAHGVFDAAVYVRGAMTVQALRNRVGETDFWAIVRAWLDTRGGGNGSSADFEALAAQVSGEDLAGFFEAWLRTPARPAPTADNGLA